MKILMYGWEFPPHISGGLGVACFGMTKALVERGHEITFVVPRLRDGDYGESHVRLVGINQFPVASKSIGDSSDFVLQHLRDISSHLVVYGIDSPLSPYLNEEQYRRELGRVGRTGQGGVGRGAGELDETSHYLEVVGDYGPDLMREIIRYASVAGSIAKSVPHDVIHVHDWITMLAGIEARRFSRKPLVVHTHALEPDRSGEHVNKAVFDIERFGMEQADRIVAVSHYTKKTIVERYGISPEKIEVVHNAVTRDAAPHGSAYKKERKEKVILFLGRITFQKGPDYFVEAAAKVLKHRDDVRFVMAGSGDMAPRMIERIAELKLGRKFHFTGFLRGAEVEKMYRESDVYVMPSVSEPFGISPLEAMHYDVPVIISKQSGVSEILKSALKVDFWDVDDLANKMLAMLDHPPLRKELVENGAAELKGIQWDTAARYLTEIYEKLPRPKMAV